MTEAGQGQVPVGQLLGQQPQRPSKWRALTQWRSWSIPVKLSAVTLVPIVIALALGATTISNQVERADSYQRIGRLVVVSSDARTLLDALQRERNLTMNLMAQGTANGNPELNATRADVDKGIGQLNTAAERAGELDSSVGGPNRDAMGQLARLKGLRDQVGSGQLEAAQMITEYSVIADALLKLDTTLTAGISDDAFGGTPSALHDLQVAKEELSFSQAMVAHGIARATLTPSELNELRTAEIRLADRLDDFRAAADADQRQDFETTVAGPELNARGGMVNSVLADTNPKTSPLRSLNMQQWTDTSNTVVSRITDVSKRLGAQVDTAAAKLVDDSSSGAGLLAVLLFGALVLAAAVVFLITRQLLRSLRVLRVSALDVAERQLPAAVQNIQEGREQSTEVQQVPVPDGDEIGEVARAFDAVHSQALRLAVEQAAMRTGYGSVFVNLSRRSQSLVQRQLQMIERLERDEEDADQLATLFQLDHLATRMRRNNENLMVLSGSEPGRRSGQPVTATDVLRAAVSEIEQYQRVVVQQPPEVRIVGYAASDLMRLIAELLDNATAFSAPETKVTVSTDFAEDGALLIEIIDQGIGMNEAEVAEANARLNEAASVDLATSRRMGLFVVGRLASRHNIGVFLRGGKDLSGVRAAVTVPAELVMGTPGGGSTTTAPEPEPSASDPGSLPRRQPASANGTSRAGALSALGAGVAVPAQGTPPEHDYSGAEQSWPGESTQYTRAPSDVEISGTALFSPIGRDDEEDEPPAPPSPSPRPRRREPEPEPQASDELPSGSALFAAANNKQLSDWWSTAAEPKPEPEPLRASGAETTPIFDETLSAWFREEPVEPPKKAQPAQQAQSAPAAQPTQSAQPAQEEQTPRTAAEARRASEPEPEREPESEPERKAASWAFASDESWRTVEAVSKTEPSDFTQAGLPRRRRGEQLLPGSAATSEPAQTRSSETGEPSRRSELPVRDPADVRGRLSRFQQGVNRGRQASHRAESPEQAAPASQPEAPVAGNTGSEPESQQQQALPPLPRRQPQKPPPAPPRTPAAQPRQPAQQAPQPSRADTPEAQPLPQRQQSRRSPRPSPQPSPQPFAGEQPERFAEQTRPQAFTEPPRTPRPEQPEQEQQALPQRGRQSQPEPRVQRASAPAEPTQAPVEWPEPSASPEPAASSETRSSTPATEDRETTSAWSFASDDGWQTARAVSQSSPSSYTAAGLPRRRRGEQLLPGSAVGANTSPSSRQDRDPQDVRGRLSSFQQGIRRGRHRTAQPGEGNQETMEGE